MISAPSITFQVRGGIGNQLFMYAMARRLALVNHVPLYIETESGFEGDFFRRNYGLDRVPHCRRANEAGKQFKGISFAIQAESRDCNQRDASLGISLVLPRARCQLRHRI